MYILYHDSYMQLLQSHTAYQPNPSLTSSFIFVPLTRTIAISDGKLTCEEWVVKVWNVARQAEVCSYRISINEAEVLLGGWSSGARALRSCVSCASWCREHGLRHALASCQHLAAWRSCSPTRSFPPFRAYLSTNRSWEKSAPLDAISHNWRLVLTGQCHFTEPVPKGCIA